MRLSQKEHTHTRLAYAAAHSQRKIAVEQVALERELCAFGAASLLELSGQRLGIDANAHARQLICHIEQRIIYDDIAVETPVVIVGRASVVDFAGAELAAYLHDKYRTLVAGDGAGGVVGAAGAWG